ncbi:hypothetical protein V1519DRAFT_434615 [Lipomyces tetrasporus]
MLLVTTVTCCFTLVPISGISKRRLSAQNRLASLEPCRLIHRRPRSLPLMDQYMPRARGPNFRKYSSQIGNFGNLLLML